MMSQSARLELACKDSRVGINDNPIFVGRTLTEKLFDRFRLEVDQLRTRRRFRLTGVSAGPDWKVFGVPVITRKPGSVVTLGSGVVLVSRPEATALGISHRVILRAGPEARLVIGDNVGLSGSTICAVTSVTIGNRVLLGPDVIVTDSDGHSIAAEGRRSAGFPAGEESNAVVIGDDVFVGARTMVMKGAHIGAGSVIGAGSLVLGTIPPNSIAVGSPAKVVGTVPPKS